ncbi:kinesin-like protein KIN-10A [Benincasa hispida]|uniref:kinesin-like protein KIN-10A n=1 Tax=Benincasa hispida TaxID=102211 RepID=UPI001902672A|nr:kinesin-like protein KIN-10A [Benincasa hispida]
MAPTPSSKSNHGHISQLRTPQAKRLNFINPPRPHSSPFPNSAVKDSQSEHPVEVIGRIRDYPDRKDKPVSILQINPDGQNVRVRADFGYRDFSLDGISLSEEEDLDSFYKKFVEARIHGVKLGEKCTIMMYGPTGAGKSHTMFGCAKQPGIVYRSLKDILGDGESEAATAVGEGGGERLNVGMFVQVTVLEIYNEEIYDLLSSNSGGGLGLGWPKGSASKVKLEVMGKKAKNATYLSGNEAGKISKEIQKVEKRRIVKSTLCNERSSRSHCMIILDVPTVGGRLMLVDMAGSENIEQAGQVGFEAKMQTAKINQGNIALKRVVESIANGDSHVPFRDSKLTMLLQDSFEDDKSKILMILCASPDPKELHKTISTLEYGAKAKCIVRGPHTPTKDKCGADDSASAVILGSRIAAMDDFIFKLQKENKLREKERNEAHRELMKKEEQVSALRAKLELAGSKGSGVSEEEINSKVNERTQLLKLELERKLEECQRMANEFVELERRRMEERILQQQQEVEMLRRRLEEIESELLNSRDATNNDVNKSKDMDGCRLAKRLLGVYASAEAGMVKSMDLDMDDQEPIHEVKLIGGMDYRPTTNNGIQSLLDKVNEKVDLDVFSSRFGDGDRVCLSTVFEEEEAEEEEEKEVIEEKRVCTVEGLTKLTPDIPDKCQNKDDFLKERSEIGIGLLNENECSKDTAFSRKLRIQNIFTLCGNHRELSQQIAPIPEKKRSDDAENQHPSSPLKTIGEVQKPASDHYTQILSDLTNQNGAVLTENEETMQPIKLQVKGGVNSLSVVPLSPIPLCSKENKLPVTPNIVSQQSDGLSPRLCATPFITVRRH